jgi:hypothetical protein
LHSSPWRGPVATLRRQRAPAGSTGDLTAARERSTIARSGEGIRRRASSKTARRDPTNCYPERGRHRHCRRCHWRRPACIPALDARSSARRLATPCDRWREPPPKSWRFCCAWRSPARQPMPGAGGYNTRQRGRSPRVQRRVAKLPAPAPIAGDGLASEAWEHHHEQQSPYPDAGE